MKLIGNLIYHKEWIMLNACHSVYTSYRYMYIFIKYTFIPSINYTWNPVI